MQCLLCKTRFTTFQISTRNKEKPQIALKLKCYLYRYPQNQLIIALIWHLLLNFKEEKVNLDLGFNLRRQVDHRFFCIFFKEVITKISPSWYCSNQLEFVIESFESITDSLQYVFILRSLDRYALLYYFLLYSKWGKNIGIPKIFDFRFLTDLHVLGCPEYDFTIFTKYLCVCDTNFVAAVAQKLMDRIAWDFSLEWPQFFCHRYTNIL